MGRRVRCTPESCVDLGSSRGKLRESVAWADDVVLPGIDQTEVQGVGVLFWRLEQVIHCCMHGQRSSASASMFETVWELVEMVHSHTAAV